MSPEDQLKVLAHVQYIARHFNAWRGSLESLIPFINYSIGPSTPPPDQIDLFLRKESTQRLLQSNYETAFWRATDKSYRLICLAVPLDAEVARRRLSYHPASTRQCRWCHVEEKLPGELRPELDIRRELVPASYLHPNCQRPWHLMRALVERADLEANQPKSKPEPEPPTTAPPLIAKRGPGRPRKSQ